MAVGVFVELTSDAIPIQTRNFYALIAAQISAFNYAMTLVPIANVLLRAGCLGVLSTEFAYFGVSLVLERINAAVYSLIDIIVSPVLAASLGYLVFGEVPAGGMIIGGGLLLFSGFWRTREMSRGKEKASVHPCRCA